METRSTNDTPPALPLAVRELSEQEQSDLLRALLQSTDYGVLVTDHQGDDLVANRRLGELFGLDPQDMVRLAPTQVRRRLLGKLREPGEFVRRLEEIYQQPDLTLEDEIELVRPQERILRRHTAPVKNARGENVGRIWTFLDITQTRRLQAEVERAAAALQAEVNQRTADLRTTTEVLQAMAQIVRAISGTREIPALVAEITARVSHLFGHRAAAVLLLSPGESGLAGSTAAAATQGFPAGIRSEPQPVCLSPEDDPLLWDALAAADATQPRLNLFHETVPAVIGALGCHVASLVPLVVRGRVAGALLLGSDSLPDPANRFLHEHIEAVAGLIALAIETHLLQSELQTANCELREAQDRLVAAEKLSAAATLATSVAHDIRNIITPLNVELGLLSEAPNEALRAAREQVNRLAVLTQRLLAFSRPTQLQRVEVSVRTLFDHLQPLLATQAELEGVTLRLDDRTGGAVVWADVARLEQLFLNLAFNAFHAMAPRGGELTMRAEREGPRLALRFEDTGSGIPPEHLPHLFQPFFTTKTSGTGLGLFSCQRIAADHGGALEAANRSEGGACFTLWLPCGQPPGVSPPRPAGDPGVTPPRPAADPGVAPPANLHCPSGAERPGRAPEA
jgi:two-component system, NtrC family, sensor kinase